MSQNENIGLRFLITMPIKKRENRTLIREWRLENKMERKEKKTGHYDRCRLLSNFLTDRESAWKRYCCYIRVSFKSVSSR